MLFKPVPVAHRALSEFIMVPLFPDLGLYMNDVDSLYCDTVGIGSNPESFAMVEGLPLVPGNPNSAEIILLSVYSDTGMSSFVLFSLVQCARVLCERISSGEACTWPDLCVMFYAKDDFTVAPGAFFDCDSNISRRLLLSSGLQTTYSAARFARLLWTDILAGGGIAELERIQRIHATSLCF
jgi:hypothetical protein